MFFLRPETKYTSHFLKYLYLITKICNFSLQEWLNEILGSFLKAFENPGLLSQFWAALC